MKKLLFVLFVVAITVAAVSPAAAQGPRPVNVVTAGTHEDPFGGNPIIGGIGLEGVARYATQILPGGVPSTRSGDGTAPRKAIYIASVWNPAVRVRTDIGETPGTAVSENEIPSCATVTIPGGQSRWFKMDTWKTKKLQVWVDDELDGATRPSGRAVFGAAWNYMWGSQPGDSWQARAVWGANPHNEAERHGFFGIIYTPLMMTPHTEFAPPNAYLYTATATATGGVFRIFQAGNPRGLSALSRGPGSFHLMEYVRAQPSHLLWYEGVLDGWVHLRVLNQMIWNGTITACSYRAPK